MAKKKIKVKKSSKERSQELIDSYKKRITRFFDENKKELTYDEYVEKFGDPYKKKEVK